MFAYVGGLCIFLATFSQMLIHYIIRFYLDAYSWIKKLYLRHRGGQLFLNEQEESLNADGCTELYQTATDSGDSASSYHFLPDEDEIDGNDMGNILINASIG